MNLNDQELKKALKELQNNYPNSQGNNKKSIGSTERQAINSQTYKRLSMKRSRFWNLDYINCDFENISYTASSFHNIFFINTKFTGNSFACCNFFDCKFFGEKDNFFSANNYSQSSFTNSAFQGITFKSSGFLQTLFYKCSFENIYFLSNTLEGSCFNNCEFTNVQTGDTNVEFIELLNTRLNNVEFPFYQFAYIIGASNYINGNDDNIYFKAGPKRITCDEYIKQINNLILFYLDKQEYFPSCNLLIASGKISDARSTFINGINQALENLDFRMIRHFCRLAKRHDLLDDFTIRRARKAIETYLLNDNIPPERLNDYIINAGEIREILLSGKSNSVTYSLNIRTNVCKKNKKGVQYVNELSNEINQALSRYDIDELGFQVAVSNHSPFEIIIDVIGAVGTITSIAKLIWGIIERRNGKNKSNEKEVFDDYKKVDKELYEKYIDSRIELCKEQLFNIKAKYKGQKLNKYIEEITQQLKTDLSELYSKDIMIFKIDNSNSE